MNGIKLTRIILVALIALTVVGFSSWVQAGIEFSVTGPNVNVTKDGKAINKEPQEGDKLYISCKFTPTGSDIGPYQPVTFQFKVNGQVTRNVLAPVTPGKTISMGNDWTPGKAGKYLVSCEVNPDKAYKEANYGDNKKEIWVTVAEKTPMVTLGKSPVGQVGEVVAAKPPISSGTQVTTRSPKEIVVDTGKPFLPLPLPDLKIDTVWTASTTCNPAAYTLAVNVGITNVGNAASMENPDNIVSIKPDFGLAGSWKAIPALSPKEHRTVQVQHKASGQPSDLAGKKVVLDIQLNPKKAVPEGNYDNNSTKFSVDFPSNFCK
ncbi:MAG: hypothetical protein KG012_02945 [Deltaproteobacteria bacterium]|nr:hypothetical protein [Deltaproteobacteria bacterium]